MKTLKESLLRGIEDTLQTGDDYNKMYKKAEKDYKKLLAKTKGESAGQYYIVSINSEALWNVLAGDNPIVAEYKRTHPKYFEYTRVVMIYNIGDLHDNGDKKFVTIHLSCKMARSKTVNILVSKFEYANEKIANNIDTDQGIKLTDACGIISNAFAKKYPNLSDIISRFNDNINYTVRL